jgi:hypothetical protein
MKTEIMKNLNWTEKMVEVLENSPFETIELESSTDGLVTYKHKYKNGYLQWIITHYRHLGKIISEIGVVSDLKRGSWGCKVTGRNTNPNIILKKMVDIVNNPYKYI